MGSDLYQRIYRLVHQVPKGYVTTYGELGRQVGCSARTVGFAMAALPKGHDVPWQRVINSQGKLSPRADGDGRVIQQLLLEAEGVRFNERQTVDLHLFAWRF